MTIAVSLQSEGEEKWHKLKKNNWNKLNPQTVATC